MFQRFFGENNTTIDIDVHEAQRLQQAGAQLIDVREPDEFRSGHAQGAINIPLGKLAQQINKVREDGTVVVICLSGARSKRAQGILQQMQRTDVRNVRGGTGAWMAAHLPME